MLIILSLAWLNMHELPQWFFRKRKICKKNHQSILIHEKQKKWLNDLKLQFDDHFLQKRKRAFSHQTSIYFFHVLIMIRPCSSASQVCPSLLLCTCTKKYREATWTLFSMLEVFVKRLPFEYMSLRLRLALQFSLEGVVFLINE